MQAADARAGAARGEVLARAFDTLQEHFRKVTRRAFVRFDRRDWHGVQRDGVERLGLYRQAVDEAILTLRAALRGRLQERAVWARLKRNFAACIAHRPDRELAESFFNSVTRRLFSTVGVDPLVEFVDSDFDAPLDGGGPVFETLSVGPDSALEDVLGDVLRRLREPVPRAAAGPRRPRLHTPFAHLEHDVRAVAAEVRRVTAGWPAPGIEALDVVPEPFFRNQGAYMVGRLRGGGRACPLLLALLHPEGAGLVVDAALCDEAAASVVFSFTHSYFHVEVERPHALVAFLREIMPKKPVAELYTALGFNKHGKTELYRHLLRHLRGSDERFAAAPGERGMVMTVFTMPGFDVVFKIIRDRFAEPKTTTREKVMDRYQLVFRHDRAGRLVDAQEFEHLEFETRRFEPELLADLRAEAASNVFVRGERVEIRHLYTERRLVPLDVYLRGAGGAAARRAVSDYGHALRDLAATNIFPGDLLLKNFGVTRHGRVVFYDYDELALLTDCRFRVLPRPRGDDDEWRRGGGGEPWLAAHDEDVFPEQMFDFVGLPRPLRAAFIEEHGELTTPRYWRGVQARLRKGELNEICAYPNERRLPRPR